MTWKTNGKSKIDGTHSSPCKWNKKENRSLHDIMKMSTENGSAGWMRIKLLYKLILIAMQWSHIANECVHCTSCSTSQRLFSSNWYFGSNCDDVNHYYDIQRNIHRRMLFNYARPASAICWRKAHTTRFFFLLLGLFFFSYFEITRREIMKTFIFVKHLVQSR